MIQTNIETGHSTRQNRLLLIIIIFFDLMGFSLIFPIIPDLLKYYTTHASSADSLILSAFYFLSSLFPGNETGKYEIIILGGLIASLYSILQFFFSPLWGKLSDRIGRRPVLIITSTGLGISYLIWALGSGFTGFFISRIFGGMMSGNIGVATAAMVDMSDAKSRTKNMGLIGAALGMGFILGPALGGFAASVDLNSYLNTGIFHPFAFCALLSALVALISAIINFLKFKETLLHSSGEKRSLNPLALIFSKMPSSQFQMAAIINFMYTALFSAFEFTVTFFYSLDFSLKPHEIGLVFFFLGIMIAIGQGGLVRYMSGKVTDRFMVMLGLTLIPVSLLILPFSPPHVVLSLIVLTPLAIGSSILVPALASLSSHLSPVNKQGESMGIFRSYGSLARAVGPMIGASIYFTSGIQTTYWILAFFLIITFSITFTIKAGKSA